jgi:F420-dependent oxidoreductase-like protein
MLEDIPRHGPDLARKLREVGGEIKRQAEATLADLYPKDPDGATPIAYLMAKTERLRFGSGIFQIGTRTPALIGMTAQSLDQMSGGRFMLGLGTSGPAVIENWHGVPFDRPIQRTREYVEIIRLALSGQRVNYEGELFHLRGFRLGFRPPRSRIPIYIASLSPRNLELTGELADGWLPVFLSPRHMAVFTDHLQAGAGKAGRGLADLDVAPYILTLVADDIAMAKSLCRQHIAYYVGGMGEFYNNLVGRYGFAAEAALVKAAWAKGDREAAAAAVSDAMLDALAIVGTAAEGRRKLEEYLAAGVTHAVLSFPHDTPPPMIRQTIAALAP